MRSVPAKHSCRITVFGRTNILLAERHRRRAGDHPIPTTGGLLTSASDVELNESIWTEKVEFLAG